MFVSFVLVQGGRGYDVTIRLLLSLQPTGLPAPQHSHAPVGIFITLRLLKVVGGAGGTVSLTCFGARRLEHVFYLICLSHVWLLLMFFKVL